MNKIIKFFILASVVLVAFTVGYKLGDARGYNQGYDVGYSYDCRAEIDAVLKRSDSISKAMEYVKAQCTAASVEYHKIKYELRSDSVFKATGKRMPSFDEHIKAQRNSTREALKYARENGKI